MATAKRAGAKKAASPASKKKAASPASKKALKPTLPSLAAQSSRLAEVVSEAPAPSSSEPAAVLPATLTLRHEAGILRLAADAGGAVIVAGWGAQRAVQVWDGTEGRPLSSLPAVLDFACDDERRAIVVALPDAVATLDPETGGRLRAFEDSAGCSVLAIASAARRLAGGHRSGAIRVWDLDSGARLHEFKGHRVADATPAIESLAFSGGTLLSVGWENRKPTDMIRTVRAWDVETGAALSAIAKFQGYRAVIRIQVLNDGHAAVGHRDTIQERDPATGLSMSRWTWIVWDGGARKAGPATASAPSGLVPTELLTLDARHVVRWLDQSPQIEIRDRGTGGVRRVLAGHEGGVLAALPHPDGRRLATAGADAKVRVWDIASGECAAAGVGHAGPVSHLVFAAAGGRLISGGLDGRVCVHELAAGAVRAPVELLDHHAGEVTGMAALAGGARLLTSGADRTLKVWDVHSRRAVRSIRTGGDGGVFALAVHPDGRRAAASGVGALEIWDVDTGALLESFEGIPDNGPLAVTLELRADVVAGRWIDGSVIVGRLGGDLVRGFDRVSGAAAIALAPSGDRVAIARSDHGVELWSVAGKKLSTLAGAGEAVALAFLGTERLAAAGEDGAVRIVDLATGRSERTLSVRAGLCPGPASCLHALPGGRLVSVDEAGVMALCDPDREAPLWAVAAAPGGLAAFSVDVRGAVAVVAGRDRSVSQWDLARGERTGTWSAPEEVTACAALDGGLAAYGDTAGHVTFPEGSA